MVQLRQSIKKIREQEQKKEKTAWQKMETMYQSLFENTGTATFIIDEDMTIIMANAQCEKLTRYLKIDLEGRMKLIDLIIEDQVELVCQYHSQRRQANNNTPNNYETCILNKDGEYKDILLHASLIPETNQSIISCMDITSLKQTQKALQKSEDRLRQAQKMEAVGTLSGGIAHDFNNILAGILGYTELAQSHTPEKCIKTHYDLKQILKACNRAKDLIKQILEFSRENNIEFRALKIDIVIKEAINFLKAIVPKNIKFQENIDTASGFVMADHTQIHQVVMNLCTNAAHAMKEKGGILNISIQPVTTLSTLEFHCKKLPPGKYVKLVVADTGTGMDKNTLERIFDPYFTRKSKQEGSGLGLAVTHGIIINHGGAVDVKSTPGKGSKFTVFFPKLEKKIIPNQEKNISIPAGSEKILFVDDEGLYVDIAGQLLKSLGYQVVVEQSSIKALDIFRYQAAQFDIVITDQTMPGMTGLQLASEVMKIRPDIPIILCTGFSESITREKAISMGIAEFVKKPVKKSELAVTIRKVLDDNRTEYLYIEE